MGKSRTVDRANKWLAELAIRHLRDVADGHRHQFRCRYSDLFTMCTDGVIICVDPPIPNTYLNSFAGWLLKGMLLSTDTIENDVPCSLFFVEHEEEGVAEIDQDFLRYFAATPDDDPLKRMLVAGNDNLQEPGGVLVGAEIFTSTFVDLHQVLKQLIVDSEGRLSCIEVNRLAQPHHEAGHTTAPDHMLKPEKPLASNGASTHD